MVAVCSGLATTAPKVRAALAAATTNFLLLFLNGKKF
jgi:hypothetical protein